MTPPRTELAMTHANLLICVAGLALALAPHVERSPLGTVAFAVLALWRLLGAFDYLPLPDRKHRALWIIKQLLAVFAFGAVYIRYRGQIGRDAGIILLTVLLGLKVLELERERDFYIVSFLAYFLVVTHFFYSQSVLTGFYMLLVVILITTSLVRFNSGVGALSFTGCMRLATKLVIQALPLMVLAFVLFPRLPGPLWGLPQDAFSAVTGLSDSMTLGRITALGASDEIAFRAKFEGEPPAARDLYWRGPVFSETDGRTWRPGVAQNKTSPRVLPRGPLYHYSVLLEPTAERWLLALDAVTTVDSSAHVNADLTLRTPVEIN